MYGSTQYSPAATAASSARRYAIEAGIADASGTAFYLVNAYVSDAGATWLQTLNEQAQPGLYTFGFNQIDQWRVSAFAAPSGSPEYVFTQHNCISMTRQSPDGSQVPVYRVHAQSGQCGSTKPTLAPCAAQHLSVDGAEVQDRWLGNQPIRRR